MLRELEPVFFWTQTRQINGHFGDITTECIEQKDHLWCLWDILECQQNKLFKGKAWIISLFLSFVSHLAGWNMIVCLIDGVLSSDNRMVCYRRKAVLKSDTLAGLTTIVSLTSCRAHPFSGIIFINTRWIAARQNQNTKNIKFLWNHKCNIANHSFACC